MNIMIWGGFALNEIQSGLIYKCFERWAYLHIGWCNYYVKSCLNQSILDHRKCQSEDQHSRRKEFRKGYHSQGRQVCKEGRERLALNSTSQKQPGVTGSVNSQERQGKILAILSTIDTTFLGYRTEIHKFRLCFINSQVYNVSWHQKETKQNNEIPINI